MTIIVENRRVDAVVVDNDVQVGSAISDMLNKKGIVSEFVGSFNEAVVSVTLYRAQVVLIHLRLLGGGIALAKQLRSSPETCGISVIIISGAEESEIERAVLDVKSDGYIGEVVGLQRPMKIDDLRATVEKLMVKQNPNHEG